MSNTTNKLPYPKIKLGVVDSQNIYLSPPSWDCSWYWGWGYLGNSQWHYHIDGLTKVEKYNRNKKVWEYKFLDLKSGIDEHFGASYIVKSDRDKWIMAELFASFYALKETAEVLGRGGSRLTSNPAKDIIINKDEVARINNIVLPKIFEETYKILLPYTLFDREK